jgi:hypothetical protein
MNADQYVGARVSPATKARLRALAARENVSESAIIKRLLELAAPGDASPEERVLHPEPQPSRDARLSVRLRPEDLRLLRARAESRRMAAATYVSVLVRAHLHALAPLPETELTELKHTVTQLGALGRLLNQIARAVNTGQLAATTPGHVQAMLRLCTAMRDHVKALIKANARSWDQGYSDEKS